MKKIYYLKSCDSCKKIMDQVENLSSFELREIKSNPISVHELEALHQLSSSYERLFNKRAQLYKEKGLKDQVLTEEDFKKYILEHYTFLARPIIVLDNQLFVGNGKKVVEEMLKVANK